MRKKEDHQNSIKNDEQFEAEDICTLCFRDDWKIIIEHGYKKQICTNCGYEKRIEPEQLYLDPENMTDVSGSDQWDGVMDNIERLVERLN
jgi:hypothetical protein